MWVTTNEESWPASWWKKKSQELSLSPSLMSGRRVKYAVVDAFASTPFAGNPAAICLLEDQQVRDEQWMKLVAAEFNLSETAFLSPAGPILCEASARRFHLRWFTPIAEVDLCGHATLAAAHFLFSSNEVRSNRIEFLTRSGILTADKVEAHGGEKDGFTIQLDFPLIPVEEDTSLCIQSIGEALGGFNINSILKASNDTIIVEFASGDAVKDLRPQFDKLEKCPGIGVIVTGAAPQGSEFDFFTRFFCPKLGIKEDPVCGMAHCALTPYWSWKLTKHNLVAYMASPRGGKLNLQFMEDLGRVLIRGEAITIMTGSILV